MTEAQDEPPTPAISTDLVEYIVLVMPDIDALTNIAGELSHSIDTSAIRILDVVVVSVGDDGAAEFVEAGEIAGLDHLRAISPFVGALLSRHDVELVAMALRPRSAAIIIVVEDRWAGPVSAAARAAGGEVRAGERIGRERVEAALARAVGRGKQDE